MFENKYTPSKEIAKDYAYDIFYKKKIKKYIIIEVIFLAILAGIYFFVGWESLYFLFRWLFIVYACCVPIIYFLFLYTMYKQYLSRHFVTSKNTADTITIIFDDSIMYSNGSVSVQYEYSQIQKIVIGKKIVFLFLTKNFGLVVSKIGFANGTNDDFLLFMRERCKNLKKNDYIENLYMQKK